MNSYTHDQEDILIVKGLINSDLNAFNRLFKKYSSRLYYFALKYLHSKSDAEEIVQEVFIKIWEKREGIIAEFSFRSYLFTIAYNVIRKAIIKEIKEKRYLENYFLDREVMFDLNADETDYINISNKINDLIEKLPPKRREVFRKSRTEGLSYKDIASELNITEKTVENHIHEALKFLHIEVNKFNLLVVFFFFLFF
jgi:RNA polymerase sigma-70 factor (family 1)